MGMGNMISLQCIVCGEEILGEYIVIDDLGNVAHPDCWEPQAKEVAND